MTEVLMKALKSFRGEKGETSDPDARIRAGREFTATSVQRARAYERGGLAVPVVGAGEYPVDDGKDPERPEQHAAPAPTDTPAKEDRLRAERRPSPAGGRTGAETARSSLRADRAQPASARRSKK